MTSSRQKLGRDGEELAAGYLRQLGYEIVGRNVRLPGGELDIVALDGEMFVFVEVRTRSSTTRGTAAESVNCRKRQKLRQLALVYAVQQGHRLGRFRFDVVAVDWPKGGEPMIRHIPHAL